MIFVDSNVPMYPVREPAGSTSPLEVAVMRRHAAQRIMSFDADFDRYPGIARIA